MIPLYDYFVVVGYNSAFGLKQERCMEFGDNRMPKSPLDATYEAQIIQHIPSERPDKAFVPEICSLAMPSGLRLFTEQRVPREPSFHSFVVIREDGLKVHGCSLIFYEELRSSELRQQIFDAQLAYLRDFASFPSTSRESFNSDKKSEGSEFGKLSSRKFAANSLPRKLSASRGMSSTNPSSASRSTKEECTTYFKHPKSPLFISKCFVLLTPIPIIYSSENLLHNLWMIINDRFSGDPVSFEDILFWCLHKLYLPPPGLSLNVLHSHFQVLVRRPAPGDFPFFDYPIETLFNNISVDKFLKLLTCFMLEKQILIVSRNARTLMLIAECLSALVFPFIWNMAYCPILPHTQLKFLEAPFPWLMGLCLESEALPEEFSQSNICLLDIDSSRLEVPEDLPSFPRLQQISLRINNLLKEFSTRVLPSPGEIHQFYIRGLHFNFAVRSIFIDHFAALFSSYEDYLLTGGQHTIAHRRQHTRNRRKNAKIMHESSATFDKISFLVDQPESVLPFLSAFLETQMFASFIDNKMLTTPDQSQEAQNTAIFDRRIAALRTNVGDEMKYDNNITEASNGLSMSPPISRNGDLRPVKNNGFVPNLDPALFNIEKDCVYGETGGEPVQKKENEIVEPKEQLIMSTEKLEDSGNDKEKNTSMNLAHQNWKFVEQLLKETKARTKRILVTKMGKEAVHLGHGHVGISGVEENTLVASFCDLLERIWSHGLKKKQGKSSLWSYIVAFHESEKRSQSRIASRRTSAVAGDSSSPEESIADQNRESDSPKALAELLSSIRKIAGTLDVPCRDSSPHFDDPSSTHCQANNWSQSLLRAANVICEKMAPPQPQQSAEGPKRGEKPRPDQSVANNSRTALLPPLPPSSKQNAENQWRRMFLTPQARRRNQHLGGGGQTSAGKEERERRTPPMARECSGEEEGGERIDGKYRKFIYQGPLKAVNNQQQQQKGEKGRGRETERVRVPRSASTRPNGPSKNLATLSEDLSKVSLREAELPAQRSRTRDCAWLGGVQMLPPSGRHKNNRSLSRTSSPSRLYERLTQGVMGGTGESARIFNALPSAMAYDLKNIIRMTEIKTDIGFARAFVRLALERKLLYNYLKKLLSNGPLLQKMYKRYAFLRCDDEREQFLLHLLSLNAVDFSCFTNTFLTIKMRYQVLLAGSLDQFPQSMVYVVLTGSLGCTSSIFLPANSTQFTFDFKNLGVLSTLRVGHASKGGGGGGATSQRLSKWYLDYVLVRNCVTAQTFLFRCGRWFGRGIDDGALERLLVAEVVVCRASALEDEANGEMSDCIGPESRAQSPSSASAVFLSPRKSKYDCVAGQSSKIRGRWRSPSCDRKMSGDCEVPNVAGGRSAEGGTALDNLQSLEHSAGMAVNALMKHFLLSLDEDQQSSSAKLSALLCSEEGLVPCIDEIFSHGLVQRFFQKSYPWDYVERVFAWFNQFFRNGESKKLTREQRSLVIYSYKIVERIAAHNVAGKEGKFHLFVLLCLRDHIFSGLIPLMAWTPVTGQIYDEKAFMRQPPKLSYLAKLVGSLNEFQFLYNRSLIPAEFEESDI